MLMAFPRRMPGAHLFYRSVKMTIPLLLKGKESACVKVVEEHGGVGLMVAYTV